jgi:uncharacterized protein (DUF2147 family)
MGHRAAPVSAMKSLVAAVAVLLTSSIAEAAARPISGVYMAVKQDHEIELFLRSDLLFGRIVWTKNPELKDEKNGDAGLRARRLIGLEHIQGFSKGPDGTWVGGRLYNPHDGKTYKATLHLEPDGRLIIQGRPDVPLIGGLLGALFGRITYRPVPPATQ